ncbi:MAG: aminodeoxychorismate/anthranilate synthase component II [Actinomycetota bacterium]|nr:aminodeoxychorismate/anthranilate synthase component II [Actinomycetota bacterium]
MPVRLLLIDNFDSFVYNLAQAFGALGAEPVVIRNDASIEDLQGVAPDALVISPGPGNPEESGVSTKAIVEFSRSVPVLGVCLGHQCIGAAFGGTVNRAAVGPRHGKVDVIHHDGRGVMRGLPEPFAATRYHSLAVEENSVPDDLEISARSADGTVMGLRHKHLPVEGVQFHPESILCEEGPRLLENFLGGANEGDA